MDKPNCGVVLSQFWIEIAETLGEVAARGQYKLYDCCPCTELKF